MFDCAIIGTGPAGLEAALTLKARNKNFILFGQKNSSDKVYKAHEIKNYLGLPNIKGEDFSKAFISHIENEGITITEDFIKQIYDMGDFYSLQGEKSNEFYQAKTVIIATGVKNDKQLPNEDKFLGSGVSYCATCDGALYRKKDIACIIETKDEFEEVKFLASLANHIDLFTLNKFDFEALDNVTFHDEKVKSLEGELKLNKVITDNNEYLVSGLFILKKSVPMSYLIYGIEMDDNHIKTTRLMETNLRGVFACGDIVGKPYQYIKAAGEGNIAALSAVNFLAKEKENENTK